MNEMAGVLTIQSFERMSLLGFERERWPGVSQYNPSMMGQALVGFQLHSETRRGSLIRKRSYTTTHHIIYWVLCLANGYHVVFIIWGRK